MRAGLEKETLLNCKLKKQKQQTNNFMPDWCMSLHFNILDVRDMGILHWSKKGSKYEPSNVPSKYI